MKYFCYLFIFCGFLFLNSQAIAAQTITARCIPPPIQKIYTNKKVKSIVTAQATGIEKLRDGSAIITINISKSWKENLAGEIRYLTGRLESAVPTIGKEYLFVLYQNPLQKKKGLFSTNICVGSKPLEKAQADIEWLNLQPTK